VALADWGITPDEINREWTEEQLLLMFQKRKRSFERQVEAMEKAHEEAGNGEDRRSSHASKPRRVTSEAFISRFQKIQESGGSWAHGTI
jgi:hypothetical protein